MELYNNVNSRRKRMAQQSETGKDRLRRLGNSAREEISGGRQLAEEIPEENGMPKFPQEQPEEEESENKPGALGEFMAKVKSSLGMDKPSFEEQVSGAFKRADKRSPKRK